MTSRSVLTVGIALSASLVLTACAGAEDTSAPDATQTETQETAAEATTDEATSEEATETTTEENADQAAGDDPVFGAIDAVLAEHAGGIVVSVDREDDTDTYDVDVVVDDQVLELEVDADGNVREDEREGDDEDVAEAQDATVTAAEAIQEALDQHPDGILDDASLDEDDGSLSWEISLDDADRNDLTELTIPAN